MSIRILVDLARSIHVFLPAEKAGEFLEKLGELRGLTLDIRESIRIINSFDEYYRYAKRRMMDYVFIPKDPRDSIEGRVAMQKLRLYYEGEERMAELILDRRVSLELVESALRDIGITDISVERQE